MSNFSDQNGLTGKDELADIKSLFHQAAAIYSGEPLSAKIKKDFQASLSGLNNCFILSGDEYIFPESGFQLPSKTVRRTFRNDKACAFRRKIDFGDQKKILCTCYIGKNCRNEDIAAGLLTTETQSQLTNNEATFYDYAGCLKRFYNQFASSRAIRSFLGSKGSYLYAVSSDTVQIIFRQRPENQEDHLEKTKSENQIIESILPQILSSQQRAEKRELDYRLKNLDIRKCTLNSSEIILLSFTLAYSHLDSLDRVDSDIRSLTDKIRGKIKTITKAAEALTLQKGQPVDENSLELLAIIKSALKNLENLTSRLELLEEKEPVDVVAS